MESPFSFDVDLNSFWEKTPTPLKYILIFAILVITSYFIFTKKMDEGKIKELDQMKIGITATYKLIDNFEQFKRDQSAYNKQVISYLQNLHSLIQELNESTDKKLNLLLKSGSNNTNQIVDKITMLNESFTKISKIYQDGIKPADIKDSKKVIMVIPDNKENEK